ncbi:MAG TPA: hypothetical protein VGH15_10970 [Caulobacteraceae bacterium]|jgi:hypothetical protein
MASFNIEDAAFVGPGLIIRKPGAVIAWALVWAVFLIVLTAPFSGMITALISLDVKSQGHIAVGGGLPLLGGIVAWVLLLWIGALVIGAVVQSAIIRAVLEPDNSAAAYLRFGREETFVLSVNFVKALILLAVSVLVGAAVGIVEAILGGAGPGAVLIAKSIGDFINLAVIIWVNLRFSAAAPMSFQERHFRLFEAWTLTRGQTWRLVGVAVLVAVMIAVIWLIGACAAVGGSIMILNGGPHLTDLRDLLSTVPSEWVPVLAPYFWLTAVVSLVAGALITPIALAPWPHIYRKLGAEVET